MQIKIRRAAMEDFTALTEIYRQGDELHLRIAPYLFQAPEQPMRSREFIANILANPQAILLVAEGEGVIFGLLEAELRETTPLPFLVQKRFININTLIVHEDHRRRGIGKALMAAAQLWAQQQNAKELRLSVYEDNPEAIAFYKSLGYHTINRSMRLPLDE